MERTDSKIWMGCAVGWAASSVCWWWLNALEIAFLTGLVACACAAYAVLTDD